MVFGHIWCDGERPIDCIERIPCATSLNLGGGKVHCLSIFFILGRSSDQLATDGERFGKPAAVKIDRQLRALRVRVGRIKLGCPPERLGRLVEAAQVI